MELVSPADVERLMGVRYCIIEKENRLIIVFHVDNAEIITQLLPYIFQTLTLSKPLCNIHLKKIEAEAIIVEAAPHTCSIQAVKSHLKCVLMKHGMQLFEIGQKEAQLCSLTPR